MAYLGLDFWRGFDSPSLAEGARGWVNLGLGLRFIWVLGFFGLGIGLLEGKNLGRRLIWF